MKIKLLRYVLVLAACAAVNTNFVYAQNAQNIQKKKKKGPNVSINISSTKDSVKTTYVNLGLLTNIANQKGIGLNVISSVVKNNMNGIQASGVINVIGQKSNGIMLSGLANVIGNNFRGIMASGLVNVTGRDATGLQASLFANVVGNRSNGVAIGGLMNVVGNEMDGVNIAGLANVARKNQNGLSIAGLMNATAQNANGLQVTSLINIVGHTARGMQLSAVSNVAVDMKGVQATALTNIAAESISGLQLAGAVNIAAKTRGAFQVAGLANICQKEMKGVQFAPGNYAGKLDGLQIGILNMSEGGRRGYQIGIINHSKDSTTHKIGLVNITPKTRIQMLAFTSNTSKINVAVRFKNRRTYSMLGGGTHYLGLNDKFSGAIFYRTGLYFPIAKKLELSGDLGFYHIESFDNVDEDTPRRMYSLQGRVNLEYQIQKKFGIFASGGYGVTRYYDENKFYEKKPIFAIGVVLF